MKPRTQIGSVIVSLLVREERKNSMKNEYEEAKDEIRKLEELRDKRKRSRLPRIIGLSKEIARLKIRLRGF